MNAVAEQSLLSKLSVLSPQQVAGVEDFVEFLAAKSRKQQALDRLLAVAPAIEAANAAAGLQVAATVAMAAAAAAGTRTRQTAAERM